MNIPPEIRAADSRPLSRHEVLEQELRAIIADVKAILARPIPGGRRKGGEA